MKELVVISGKGGTGKTSVVASFAALAKNAVLADCDVDAADLHLILSPQKEERHDFLSGHEAVIRQEICIACGACLAHCRFGAVTRNSATDQWVAASGSSPVCSDCDFCTRSCAAKTNDMIRSMMEASGDGCKTAFVVDPLACEGCGVCVWNCPVNAIDFRERLCGEWMASETRYGPMIHARLKATAENSGKLVSTVRREARRIAEEEKRSLILVDGPPGIGCAVIASVTGATQVLVVTEPTCAGAHDFERVVALTSHFKIPTAVCVNKWDINPEMTETIEAKARSLNVMVAGRIRYDRSVTAAQVQGLPVVEYQDANCAQDIRAIWDCVSNGFQEKNTEE